MEKNSSKHRESFNSNLSPKKDMTPRSQYRGDDIYRLKEDKETKPRGKYGDMTPDTQYRGDLIPN